MKSLYGRITGRRDHGKIIFLDLTRDGSNSQIAIQKSYLDENYEIAKFDLDIGNIVRVEGELFETKTRMKTLNVISYEILTPCYEKQIITDNGRSKKIRGNPGLEMLINNESFHKYSATFRIQRAIRDYLHEKRFLEVDTRILKDVTDTSKANSFITKANWNKTNLYLRKSTEQRLKQLLVGGLENIFELGKVFRNESSGEKFSPEFTVLELYKTYSTYRDILSLVKGMLNKLDNKIGTPPSNPSNFEEVRFYEFLNERLEIDIKTKNNEDLKQLIPDNKKKRYSDNPYSRGYILNDLFESVIGSVKNKNLCIIGYPKQINIFSKTLDSDDTLSEEFRMYVQGSSYCYGSTELTDYKEQEKRIEEQITFLNKPKENLDSNFIPLLKLGLPPCAGLGLSIERLLTTYLNNDDIRDIITFPL